MSAYSVEHEVHKLNNQTLSFDCGNGAAPAALESEPATWSSYELDYNTTYGELKSIRMPSGVSTKFGLAVYFPSYAIIRLIIAR